MSNNDETLVKVGAGLAAGAGIVAAADGKGKRGYANPKTQHAAQESRGVKNFTDWAKT